MSEDKEKLHTPEQPPPYGSVAEDGDKSNETSGDAASPGSSRSDSCAAVDTRYIRSIEGILKIVTIPIAILGIIVTSVAVYFGPSGWYYFVGIGYILYAVIVIVMETFIENVYVHRIADAVITGLYGLLWLLSGVINTAFAAVLNNIALGVASIFAYVCAGLCVAQVVFAVLFWRKNGGKSGPPKPLCGG